MKYLWPAVALILAAGLQGNLPPIMSIWGARPDLILVVLVCYSLAAEPAFGAGLGFMAGLIHGSTVGMCLGSFIVTRTITGFLAGLVTTRLFSTNPFVPVLSAVWLTVVCETLFLLGNPLPGLAPAVRKLAGEVIANGLSTFVLYLAMKHLETRRKIRLANARI